MSTEKVFVQGFIFKRNENAPSWAVGKVSIKVSEFKEFCDQHANGEWINLEVKQSQGGKYYAELDTWKPTQQEAERKAYVSDVTVEEPKAQADGDALPF